MARDDDTKEIDRLLAIGSARLHGASMPKESGAALISFHVAQSGATLLIPAEGMSQLEAEAIFVRSIIRYFTKTGIGI